MTDFKLTSGNDTFSGGATADNFFGWHDLGGGGATGGTDVLSGDAGNDHFYIEGPGQGGTIDGGADNDTVHVRATLGNVTFTTVETAEFAADGTRFSGSASQFNAFGTLQIAGATSGILKVAITTTGSVNFGTLLKGTESIDIDATGISGFNFTGTAQGDVFHLSGSSGNHQVNGGDGDDVYIYSGSFVSGFYPSQNAGNGVDTLIATDFDFTHGGFLELEHVHVDRFTATVAKINEFTEIANSSGAAGITEITLADVGNGGVIDFSTKAIAGHRISLDAREMDTEFYVGGVDIKFAGQDDVFFGSAAADTVHAGNGADQLTTQSGDGQDQLFGEGGNDTFFFSGGFDNSGILLDGGTGTDTLQARGNIVGLTYASIEKLLVDGDLQVTIAQLNGFASIGLAPGIDAPAVFNLEGAGGTLDFTSLPDLDASTNGVIVNVFSMTSAINLVGSSDNDRLDGTTFDDILAGGAGADTLRGDSGDDTYVLGSEAAGIDEIVETSGGGTDTVTSEISRSLAIFDNVENLTLLGTAVKGVGNGLANFIAGNGVANTLKGGDGDDTFVGGGGKDSYVGGDGTDFVSYLNAGKGVRVNLADPSQNTGAAKSEIFKSIEGLIGSTHNDTLIGDAKDNTLEGAGGADKLEGGDGTDTASYRHAALRVVVNLVDATKNRGDAAGDTFTSIERFDGTAFNDKFRGDDSDNIFAGYRGHDKMTGGGGSDEFVFENIGADNSDTITDFESGTDKIALKGTIFDEMTTVTADNLVVAKHAVALDADDHLIFDKTTHTLWYDFDGNGVRAAELLATFTNDIPKLAAGDFIIV